MKDFLLNSIIWTLAIYGAFEIIKTIIRISTYKSIKQEGIYIIIAVKNQENRIEGFLRNFIFRIIYGKEENIEDIIVADLNSTDETSVILNKLKDDYDNIKIGDWDECKNIIENIKKA